jgi:hypothetical protein
VYKQNQGLWPERPTVKKASSRDTSLQSGYVCTSNHPGAWLERSWKCFEAVAASHSVMAYIDGYDVAECSPRASREPRMTQDGLGLQKTAALQTCIQCSDASQRPRTCNKVPLVCTWAARVGEPSCGCSLSTPSSRPYTRDLRACAVRTGYWL